MSAPPPWVSHKIATYERPLGCMENFYTALRSPDGAPGHWIIVSATKFKHNGSLSKEDMISLLRDAWITLRLLEPQIAATSIKETKMKRYQTLDGAALVLWANKTFLIHTDGSTANEYFETVTASAEAVMHYFPQSAELLVQISHDLLDGRGMLIFWNLFYAIVSVNSSNDNTLTGRHSQPEDDVARLTPSMEELLGVPSVVTPQGMSAAENALLPFLTPFNERLGMPLKGAISPPSAKSCRCEVRLSTETTSKITAVCKSLGMTVTTAWHAAVILATNALSLGSKGTTEDNDDDEETMDLEDAVADDAKSPQAGSDLRYVSFANFDLRQYLERRNGDTDPVRSLMCCHTAFITDITVTTKDGMGKAFEAVVSQLQHFYAHAVREGLKNFAAFAAVTLEKFATGQIQSTAPVLSSLGVLENFMASSYGKDWEIEDVWIADTMMTPEIEAFLWTWRGRMVLSGCWNAAYYNEEEVMRLLKKTVEIMGIGLGVDLST